MSPECPFPLGMAIGAPIALFIADSLYKMERQKTSRVL